MEITMKGISKAFGSNEVLKGVDLTLKFRRDPRSDG